MLGFWYFFWPQSIWWKLDPTNTAPSITLAADDLTATHT